MKLALFGMFRSGTGYLWWILSKDPRFKQCYTEPLHPLLLMEREKYPHYAVYKGLPELEKYFDPDFSFNNHILQDDEEYSELKDYLEYLLQDNTLIKINRMSFRISWFMHNFPDVDCVGIIRDPRACAYAHLKYNLNGNWDSVFFDLCSTHAQYADYLMPLKDQTAHVKLIAFWRICAEHMVNSLFLNRWPIVKLEDLNSNEPQIINDLYQDIGLDIPDKVIKAAKNPSEDAWFWGAKEIDLYKDVSDSVWQSAIEVANAQDMMELFGYEI